MSYTTTSEDPMPADRLSTRDLREAAARVLEQLLSRRASKRPEPTPPPDAGES